MKRSFTPYYLKDVLFIDRLIPYYISLIQSFVFKYSFDLIDELIYQLFIKKTILKTNPIIILGHHRSGTTYLQKVISSTPGFKTTRLFDTLFPQFMYIGNYLLRPIFNLICFVIKVEMKLHRAPLHMDFPGEEDVALLSLKSPYAYNWAHIYPHHIELIAKRTIDDIQIGTSEYEYWKSDYIKFIKKLQFIYPHKRLVLKSPPSVARPHLMYDIFPDAKFIFVIRNPYTLYSSMINFWKISEEYTFQKYPAADFDKLIFPETKRLLGQYIKYRNTIPESQLLEVTYEKLKTDPNDVLTQINNKFDLNIPLDSEFSKLNQNIKEREIINSEVVKSEWSEIISFYEKIKSQAESE